MHWGIETTIQAFRSKERAEEWVRVTDMGPTRCIADDMSLEDWYDAHGKYKIRPVDFEEA